MSLSPCPWNQRLPLAEKARALILPRFMSRENLHPVLATNAFFCCCFSGKNISLLHPVLFWRLYGSLRLIIRCKLLCIISSILLLRVLNLRFRTDHFISFALRFQSKKRVFFIPENGVTETTWVKRIVKIREETLLTCFFVELAF